MKFDMCSERLKGKSEVTVRKGCYFVLQRVSNNNYVTTTT